MRLTDKNKTLIYSEENQINLARMKSGIKIKSWYYGKPIEHLAEFEDFMEEQGFESLEGLKINIEYLKDKIETDKFNYEQLHKFKNHLQQENQALKDRWGKLKDFIDAFKEYNIDEASLAWKILDKMKELEEK